MSPHLISATVIPLIITSLFPLMLCLLHFRIKDKANVLPLCRVLAFAPLATVLMIGFNSLSQAIYDASLANDLSAGIMKAALAGFYGSLAWAVMAALLISVAVPLVEMLASKSE